jgi:hypothetical protein
LGAVGDTLVIPGNLWLEPASAALTVVLPRDLVVVVQGNLYLGRSVSVAGPGRLLWCVVSAPDQSAFADLDADGKHSPGDRLFGAEPFRGRIEGAGSAFLGLARGNAAAEPMQLDVGIVVDGELHLRRQVEISGPVVLQHGVTAAGDVCIAATGRRLYRAERESLAAFGAVGPPRPGLLRALSAPLPPTGAPEQPLYVAAPAR